MKYSEKYYLCKDDISFEQPNDEYHKQTGKRRIIMRVISYWSFKLIYNATKESSKFRVKHIHLF